MLPSCWRLRILTEIRRRQAGGHIGDVVGRPTSGRPCGSTEGVVGFRTRHHMPPTQKNSRHNEQQSNGYSHGWWLEIRQATTTKRRAQNKPLARHPARGLNLRDHTNQEVHDAPWFGARGSNTGLGMAVPGGAPLCHSCYDSVSRKIGCIYTALTTKLFGTMRNTQDCCVRVVQGYKRQSYFHSK